MRYKDQPGSLCILHSRNTRQQPDYAPARDVAGIRDKKTGYPIATVKLSASMSLLPFVIASRFAPDTAQER